MQSGRLFLQLISGARNKLRPDKLGVNLQCVSWLTVTVGTCPLISQRRQWTVPLLLWASPSYLQLSEGTTDKGRGKGEGRAESWCDSAINTHLPSRKAWIQVSIFNWDRRLWEGWVSSAPRGAAKPSLAGSGLYVSSCVWDGHRLIAVFGS